MTPKTPLTLPFTEIRATDLPLVGGKGANLGEMTHAGFPIPSGFCVTTSAFQQFMADCPTADTLYVQLDQVTADNLPLARQVGQNVRETLLTVPISPAIITAVRHAWQTAGTDQPYAVRSSATAEDLPDASFAGQQDTYLNIIGETALLDAVRRCWISLFTDRAILYRCQHNFPHQEVALSVVVQQMVMSETSGILFTADPLTGHRHTATIDASFGLGEALVSGLVSPDAYQVDKRTDTILSRHIADKQLAIYPIKDGGVRQEMLSESQRDQTVLTDEQIIALAQMGTAVEAHYGSPQDIEWAMVGKTLYLLQSRPITSLYPIDQLQSPDDSLQLFFSMGHQQMMTNAMSPLSASAMRCFIPIGREEGQLESSLVRTSGGHLFANLTAPLRHPIFRRLVFTVASQFDALAPEILQAAMKRPEFQRPHAISLSFSHLRFARGVAAKVLSALWWRDLTGSTTQANELLAAAVEKMRQELSNAPTTEIKLQLSAEHLQKMFGTALAWIPTMIAGIVATRLVQRLGRDRVDPAVLDAFDLGLPGNVVNEMNLAVGDLADCARQSPQLQALFTQLGEDSAPFLAQAKKLEGNGRFWEQWEQFMAQYGFRGSSEIDMRAPRWHEEPLPLLHVINSYLQKEEGSHRTQHHNLGVARQAAVNTLINSANRGLFAGLHTRLMKRLIHVAHEGGVLREHHKFFAVQLVDLAKGVVKETAVQLTQAHKLTQPDDIWFVSWPELLTLVSGNRPDMIDLIPQRRIDFARFEKLTPPVIITSDGETPVAKYHVADAPPGALIGNPVSPGVVEGVIKVIHDPQTETLNPGDILVAPFTDPGWTPLFINAGGLIMEVGGAMTHGSVVAREYGIPAIVGVRGATEALQTGQRVRIDGNRGVIELLSFPEPT